MSFFQAPPPTRYDLRFELFDIPIRVHPLFWLIALLFGASAGGLLPILIWVVAVFISILIHELGHALAFRTFGIDSMIVLHMAGGLAIPRGSRWGYGRDRMTAGQNIIVSFAGPLAGFILAGLIAGGVFLAGGFVQINYLLGFIPIPSAGIAGAPGLVNLAIQMFLWINVFWGLINLLPVFPLDGGQIARAFLVQADPQDGFRKSLMVSVGAGALMAIVGLVALGSIYIALLFGLLAFQSYQMLSGFGGRRF